MGYATNPDPLPPEVMRRVRHASTAEAVWDAVRGPGGLHASEVLQPGVLRRELNDADTRIRNASGASAESRASGVTVPTVRDDDPARPASPRQQREQQRARERHHALCLLPYAVALDAWQERAPDLATVRRVWREVAAARDVPEALVPLQEVWRSAADDEAQRVGWAILFGPSITERLGAGRRSALQALGNAVVPQVAEIVARRVRDILEAQKR
jgi:hypothetical protein